MFLVKVNESRVLYKYDKLLIFLSSSEKLKLQILVSLSNILVISKQGLSCTKKHHQMYI